MRVQVRDRATSASDVVPYLVLTGSAVAWGANTILGRLAVGEISPMLLVSLRWGALAGLLGVLSLQSRAALHRDSKLLRPHWRLVACMGALGLTGFSALYYSAAHYTTAINIGIIQGAIPLVVLISARVFDGSPISGRAAIGIVVSASGVTLLVSGGDVRRLLDAHLNAGDMLMLLASVCYSGYAIGVRRAPTISPWTLLLALASAGFVASLPLLALESASGATFAPSTQGWMILAGVTLLPSLLGQAGFIHGVRKLGPGRAGLFLNLVPVFAAWLAVGILDEPIALHQGVALALVLAGIAWAEVRSDQWKRLVASLTPRARS